MNNKDIEWRKKKLKQIREQIESGQLNAVRELLPNHVIQQICEDCQYYFRTRLLSPLVIIFHMISAGISREASFQSAWPLNGQSGQSGSLAKGRKRLPLKIWEGIDSWMIQAIEEEQNGEDRWRGHRMIGVDGTCTSMSDMPELVQYFGRSGTSHGGSRFPLARSIVVFNLKSLIMLGHKAGPYLSGEMDLFRQVFGRLQPGDIWVADRHLSGANYYAEYLQAGVGFIMRAHQALKVEKLKVLEDLAEGDFIVEMPIHSSHRRKNSALPKSIRVRVIQTTAKIRGKKETFWIVTSLLDPERYPAQEICVWTKKRWKLEGLIEELKIWMGADILRSKTVEGIYKEMYARVMALNLIHWLILKAAAKHQQKPERLSVSAALRLTAAYSLKMSTAPAWRLPLLYEELLEHIASSTIPHRPGRMEPRMKKRLPKNYPKLKISRQEWRNLYALAA